MQVRSFCADSLEVCSQITEEKENLKQETVTTIIAFQSLGQTLLLTHILLDIPFMLSNQSSGKIF